MELSAHNMRACKLSWSNYSSFKIANRRSGTSRLEIKTMPQQRQSLDAQLAASVAALGALKSKAQHLEMDRKKLELDAGTRRESINRLKTQQYETRKNDEFRAMANEIERYEKEIQQIEDQELELMDQVDKLKGELAVEEKKAVSDARVDRTADGRPGGKKQNPGGQLNQLTAERTELASKVEEDLLSRFERLFASKGDAAVVALEHEVCTGCHMKVTTQTAHRVKNGREIVSCEQCGRILYAE